MNNPTLSVIMPVYNTEKYIKGSIDSILNQTFKDFELIIVNDGSTDNSIKIIKSYNDNRIKLISNGINKGIVYSRNHGLSVANGKYIASFDSDDIAMPDKFKKQIKYMEQHPEYGMLGTWAKLINENGQFKSIKWKLSTSSEYIPAILLFRAYFIQSAVIFRREAINEESYTEGFAPSEDYKLYFDIAKKFKVYNYPEYLTYYRIRKDSITQSNLELCLNSEIKLYKYIFSYLKITIDKHYYSLLLLIKNEVKIKDIHLLIEIEKFLLIIIEHNSKLLVYTQKQLISVVFNRWMKVCYKSKGHFFKTIYTFCTSPITMKYLKNYL